MMVTRQLLPAPFAWRAGQIAIDLPGGHARFTTRESSGGGPPLDLSDEARGAAALVAELGLNIGRLAQSPQVHGAGVRTVRALSDLERPAPEADAQATALTSVACLVRVADCLPVVLIAPQAVAAVHAGWRGLAAGVVQAAVATLRDLGASDIRAAVGPGARVCCYEAGEEVHTAFAQYGDGARRGANANLAFVAQAILRREGVSEIHDTGLCTICSQPGLFWSHRRDGEDAGRQGAVAWRS